MSEQTCPDCGRPIATRAARCMSCAQKKKWRDGTFAHMKPYKGGSRRKNPPAIWRRFDALVIATIVLELIALVWITGGISGPL